MFPGARINIINRGLCDIIFKGNLRKLVASTVTLESTVTLVIRFVGHVPIPSRLVDEHHLEHCCQVHQNLKHLDWLEGSRDKAILQCMLFT